MTTTPTPEGKTPASQPSPTPMCDTCDDTAMLLPNGEYGTCQSCIDDFDGVKRPPVPFCNCPKGTCLDLPPGARKRPDGRWADANGNSVLGPRCEQPSPARSDKDAERALRTLCDQLESAKRFKHIATGTSQTHSYLEYEDVSCFVEQARKALPPPKGSKS